MSLRTVPVGNVLVRDAGGHVEHDDAALSVDVVAIAQATKLLLAGSIPHVKLNLAQVLSQVSYRHKGCRSWREFVRL